MAQNFNTEVEAKILTRSENDLIRIAGTALNKTEINQSLRYVLSVIKNNPESSNRSKNDQSGRFVLESGQKLELSSTTINKETKDRIIVLLLVYNLDDEIIGKDRIVFNDSKDSDNLALKQKLAKELTPKEADISNSDEDGDIVLSGIVLEEVKTKAGRDFYKMFYSEYTLNEINAKEIVKIKEAILRANTTIISVFVEDRIVHRFLVKTQVDYLRDNRDISIKQVNRYLVYLKKNKDNIQSY
tara:strand:+ start:23654 stop:24382 length:729 start_codon:yes stop_codon:yes gene_type:complete